MLHESHDTVLFRRCMSVTLRLWFLEQCLPFLDQNLFAFESVFVFQKWFAHEHSF